MNSPYYFEIKGLCSSPEHRYLRLAHWLCSQQRAVSAREAATIFDVSAWSIERDFAKIRKYPGIFTFDEKLVSSRGGMKYLLRLLYIAPYWLDEQNIPHRKKMDPKVITDSRIQWCDLVNRPWCSLVKAYHAAN